MCGGVVLAVGLNNFLLGLVFVEQGAPGGALGHVIGKQIGVFACGEVAQFLHQVVFDGVID